MSLETVPYASFSGLPDNDSTRRKKCQQRPAGGRDALRVALLVGGSRRLRPAAVGVLPRWQESRAREIASAYSDGENAGSADRRCAPSSSSASSTSAVSKTWAPTVIYGPQPPSGLCPARGSRARVLAAPWPLVAACRARAPSPRRRRRVHFGRAQPAVGPGEAAFRSRAPTRQASGAPWRSRAPFRRSPAIRGSATYRAATSHRLSDRGTTSAASPSAARDAWPRRPPAAMRRRTACARAACRRCRPRLVPVPAQRTAQPVSVSSSAADVKSAPPPQSAPAPRRRCCGTNSSRSPFSSAAPRASGTPPRALPGPQSRFVARKRGRSSPQENRQRDEPHGSAKAAR